jgi:hypothetical protein
MIFIETPVNCAKIEKLFFGLTTAQYCFKIDVSLTFQGKICWQ